MKKLNKPPSKQKVIYYGKSSDYTRSDSFIFSEELPYLKRERKEKEQKISRRKRHG